MKKFFGKANKFIRGLFTKIGNFFIRLSSKAVNSYYKTPKKAFSVSAILIILFAIIYFIFESFPLLGGFSLSQALDNVIVDASSFCMKVYRTLYYLLVFSILAAYIGTSIWLLYTKYEPIWSIMVMFNSVVFIAIEMIITSAIMYDKGEPDTNTLYNNLFTAYSTCMIACSSIIMAVAGLKYSMDKSPKGKACPCPYINAAKSAEACESKSEAPDKPVKQKDI